MRQVLLIIALLIVLPFMSSCADSSKISAEEAIAIVIESGYEPNLDFPGWENAKVPEQCPHPASWGEWSASYEGKGHWIVTVVFDYGRPRWNSPEMGTCTVRYDYFEDSGIVQYKDTDIDFP
jgi:hypothetical protein